MGGGTYLDMHGNCKNKLKYNILHGRKLVINESFPSVAGVAILSKFYHLSALLNCGLWLNLSSPQLRFAVCSYSRNGRLLRFAVCG